MTSQPAAASNMRASETVVRIHRRENPYVQIDRCTIQDKRLSWEARGMLAYLLSLPPDWRISVEHLQKQGNAGRDAVRRILRELQAHGYASGFGKPDAHSDVGRFGGSVITVFETPDLNPQAAPKPSDSALPSYPIPTPEKPSSVRPTPEKASVYRSKSQQRKQETKETHTHTARTRAPSSSANAGVCVSKSHFSYDDRKTYALAHSLGGGWLNNSRDGRYDELITDWLAAQAGTPATIESTHTASQEIDSHKRRCPDCYGSGWYYPDQRDKSRGARRCKHDKLQSGQAESVEPAPSPVPARPLQHPPPAKLHVVPLSPAS